MTEPKLRFKRDDGTEYPEWEEKKLGDLGSFIRGLSYNKNEVTDDKTKTLVLRSNNIIVGGVANCENGLQYVTKRPSSEQLLIKDDVIICLANGSDSLVGKTCSYNGDYIGPITVGAFCGIYRSQSPIMHYLVQTENYRRKIILIKQGGNGALANLYGNDILTLSFSIPSCLEEQQKIAAFLSDLDAVISASEAEVAALEQQKKGAMQKIFSQEVRFRRDDGTEYPAWEEQCFAEIVEPNNIPVANPGSNYVKLAIRSHCKGTFHKSVDNEDEGLDVDTMYLVEAYNLIVNITFAWEHAIAITKPEDAGTYVSHRFPQYKFVKDNLPAFYEYVIKNPRMKYELGLCSPGGAGRNRVLNLKDFMKIRMIRPCPEEQQKIADFLSSFDEAIALAQQELEKWKLLKKGLMQQMFV